MFIQLKREVTKMKKVYAVELEDNEGRTFERFNTYQDYKDYVSDLAIESYDSRDEVNGDKLFNFKTWIVVFDDDYGELRSLTPEQFKALS